MYSVRSFVVRMEGRGEQMWRDCLIGWASEERLRLIHSETGISAQLNLLRRSNSCRKMTTAKFSLLSEWDT